MASFRIVLAAAVACVLVLGIQGGTTGKCPSICTLEFAPICGRKADGTTMEFSNGCALRIHECNHPGEIVSSERGRCM